MAGLMLRGGVSANAYSPMTPPAANSSTAGGVLNGAPSISQMAYGINGSGTTQVEAFPAYGAVAAGVIATAILVFMWWSLPR